MKTPAFLLVLLAASLSSADYIWAKLDPAAKTVSIGLQEWPDQRPLNLKERIPRVKAWTGSAKPVALRSEETWIKGDVEDDHVAVGLDYGVIDRREQGRGLFWLEYYAKAALTPEASQKRLGLPVELFVRMDAEGKPVLTVLHDGKPAAKAAIVMETADKASPFNGETGADGTIALPAPTGSLAVRAFVKMDVKGAEGGKAYDFRKRYGSLVVNSASAGRGMAIRADPRAYEMLERASLARQTMPKDVTEVTGTVEWLHDGQSVKAPFVFKPGAKATLDKRSLSLVAGEEVESQVASLFSHRQSVPFAEGNGKYALKVVREDESGALIAVGDESGSTMRVKDDELVEVSRVMHGNRFVISTLENVRTGAGKSLPKIYTVTYFDPTTGALTKAQAFRDAYVEVNGVWLPLSREIRTAKDGEISTVVLRFSDLKVSRG